MSAVSSVPVDLRDFRSALIVKSSSLGDIVHTLPAARLIKQAHPHLRLRWLANTEWTPLLDGCPFVDEVVAFPRKEFRGLGGAARFAKWSGSWNRMPRETPEIVLDFQGLLRSGMISFARGSDVIVGLSNSREGAAGFHDHIVDVTAHDHAVDGNLEMARALGIQVDTEEVKFTLPEGRAPEGFDPLVPFIVLHPFSRGAGKSLSPAVLHTLGECLSGARLVVVGVSQDTAAIPGSQVTDLTNGTTLPELIWLMRRAQACVSVDSGPMHIAAAVNRRTLGIHHWTDPRKVGPYPPAAWVWKSGRIAHRADFSPEECAGQAITQVADARRLADFILGTLTGR
jgi:ADP-heptose:LPS heptosyltransferase